MAEGDSLLTVLRETAKYARYNSGPPGRLNIRVELHPDGLLIRASAVWARQTVEDHQIVSWADLENTAIGIAVMRHRIDQVGILVNRELEARGVHSAN